ncbi:MAG: ATP-binding cassette domain-containing protein [Microvirga sp.]|nr:ATP-binding cassette domain-containing protein [Microvirga sp.]
MTEDVLSVRGARVLFPVRRGLFGRSTAFVHAVDDVSISLRANETVALVGESGSGKTTLGMAMVGLTPLTEGVLSWRGREVAFARRENLDAFRRDVQVVFQDPYASLNPRLTIGETLLRPLRLHSSKPAAELMDLAQEMLDKVGLRPARLYFDRYPHEFSGGQRQRIAIARALILNPSVIVADEPVSALDVSIRAQILELLSQLKSDLGLSMLFLSHDLGVVRFISDRVAVMYLGKLVEIGGVREIFRDPRHPYTRLLLSSAPTTGRRPIEPIEAIGEPPKPSAPPSGCRFRTRCPLAFARCAEEIPKLVAVGEGREVACHLQDGGR